MEREEALRRIDKALRGSTERSIVGPKTFFGELADTPLGDAFATAKEKYQEAKRKRTIGNETAYLEYLQKLGETRLAYAINAYASEVSTDVPIDVNEIQNSCIPHHEIRDVEGCAINQSEIAYRLLDQTSFKESPLEGYKQYPPGSGRWIPIQETQTEVTGLRRLLTKIPILGKRFIPENDRPEITIINIFSDKDTK